MLVIEINVSIYFYISIHFIYLCMYANEIVGSSNVPVKQDRSQEFN